MWWYIGYCALTFVQGIVLSDALLCGKKIKFGKFFFWFLFLTNIAVFVTMTLVFLFIFGKNVITYKKRKAEARRNKVENVESYIKQCRGKK